MSSPFNVTPIDLERLEPNLAVDLFRKLLWAEATAKRIPKNKIDIPFTINDNDDGGIDASVNGNVKDDHGLIKNGITRYQIKTGKIQLHQPNKIKSILFNEKNGKFTLKPRIESTLNDGILVIVLFGTDKDEKTNDEIKNSFKMVLADVFGNRYDNSKIEIIKQNAIIGLLFPYIALCLQVKGHVGDFYTHKEWKKFSDMAHVYKKNKKQQQKITTFRKDLLNSKKPVNIRVTGEPGIGKTRFVLEATDTDQLAPFVVYLEDPSKLSADLLSMCIREDVSTILIVDECDSHSQKNIWNKIKSKSPSLKLVTIFNEPDESDGAASSMEPEPLGSLQTADILEDYGIPKKKISKWVLFCMPSPRAAHIMGKNLKENNDLLDSDDSVDVWNRYIAGTSQMNSDEFKKRKEVLLWNQSRLKKFVNGLMGIQIHVLHTLQFLPLLTLALLTVLRTGYL